MGKNRDRVLEQCNPAMELGFSLAEYRQRLQAIRREMAARNIDLLWLMAPESLYYVSGYSCEWYQAQSPKQWPATSGIAVHVDHDKFILFDTPSERVMCRFVTCAEDIRIFPIDNRRDGIGFIMDELGAEGWLGGTVGMELFSYRPNPAISSRFRREVVRRCGGVRPRTAAGWGSKVSTAGRRLRALASLAALRKTAWWPRCTPSKFPITRRRPS